MKRCLIIIGILLLPTLSLADTGAPIHGELSIKVTNIKNASGVIYLSVQNSAEGWLSRDPNIKTFRDVSQEITSTDDIIINLDNLPAGSYAVSLFQDLNDNIDLDTNLVGYPKEPFGFSAPMGLFGPPKFDKAKIEVTAGVSNLEIKLN